MAYNVYPGMTIFRANIIFSNLIVKGINRPIPKTRIHCNKNQPNILIKVLLLVATQNSICEYVTHIYLVCLFH